MFFKKAAVVLGFLTFVFLGLQILVYVNKDQIQSDAFHAVYNDDPVLLSANVGGILGFDFRDADGCTLLMRASGTGAAKNVVYLLDKGADKTIRNANGKTAYDMAKEAYK